jgi:hypothetical protein
VRARLTERRGRETQRQKTGKERDRERNRGRKTERQRDRETDRDADRGRESYGGCKRQTGRAHIPSERQ